MTRLLPCILISLVPSSTYAEDLHVDGSAGNNTFQAVFDAKIGERIMAD